MLKKRQKQLVIKHNFMNKLEFLNCLASRLKIYNNADLSISGEDLEHMNAAELNGIISKATIFYRVSPKHKLTIVKVNPLFDTQLMLIIFLFKDFTGTRTYCQYDGRWC